MASKLNYENEQLEELYERTAWKLEEGTGIPGSAYDLFKKAVRCVCVFEIVCIVTQHNILIGKTVLIMGFKGCLGEKTIPDDKVPYNIKENAEIF